MISVYTFNTFIPYHIILTSKHDQIINNLVGYFIYIYSPLIKIN